MARSKRPLFEQLCNDAERCRACERMACRKAVLGPLNGPLTPRIVFIGEAPGRLGADRTRRPFSGDASGRNFEILLASAGLSREEVFITNAVLCCPADNRKNNSPSSAEMNNCLPFLRRTIELLRPPVVATIGTVAMSAVARLTEGTKRSTTRKRLSDLVGRIVTCDTFRWVALYHPSPRVLNTVRALEKQKADYAVLKRLAK